ncbi:hypothetical protein C7N43_30825 [Sphingobacteriales bacterium UPWRP_1]|nr:hypothetical protein C7N43_30825 [Sphingobacteriales bacterium UPWRP_1]
MRFINLHNGWSKVTFLIVVMNVWFMGHNSTANIVCNNLWYNSTPIKHQHPQAYCCACGCWLKGINRG